MTHDKENDANGDSRKQTKDIEVTPQEKSVEATTENNCNVEPDNIMEDAKSDERDEGYVEEPLSDAMKPKLNDSADTGISEGKSVVGCVEQQVTESVDGVMTEAVKSKEEIIAAAEKILKGSKDEMDDECSSDSDLDYSYIGKNNWSKYRKEFEKCLTKLKVRKEDVKQKPFDELCKMMVQPMALYRERRRFYFARRAEKESIEEFIKRLTDLSSTCQFDESRDIMVADKCIVSELERSKYSGLGKKSPWTGLQQEVDFKKALEIAQKEGPEDDADSFIDRLMGIGKGNSKIPPHLAEMIRNEIMEQDFAVGKCP